MYDVYKSGTDFYCLLNSIPNLIEILGANTKDVTDMGVMVAGCSALSSVPLFDTSNVTNMAGMFQSCTSLTSVPLYDTSNVTAMTNTFRECIFTSVPLFNTSSVTEMSYTFYDCTSLTSIPLFDTSNIGYMYSTFGNCVNVETGALALYQQVTAQQTVPSHLRTFYNCGSNTVQGAAELAQIPNGWK